MTERLTKRNDNSIYGNDGCMSGCDTCSWCECSFVHKMIEKLAYYEDLEAHDRLVVLPEGVNKEAFLKILAMDSCPTLLGLKYTENCHDTTCTKCWEDVLKGE